MRKKLIVIVFMFTGLYLYAGDVASFVNLGFSADSRYFMFAEYGVTDSEVYSDLYTVDVVRNVFIQNGVLRKKFPLPLSSMEDGTGALYKNILESAALVRQYSIDSLNKGRYLYVNINGDDARQIDFRDFKTGRNYKISLIQDVSEKEGVYNSSFIINVVTVNSLEKTSAYIAGSPDIKRKDVSGYRIKQVIADPDDKNLIIVVEKIMNEKGAVSIRYMVETLKL